MVRILVALILVSVMISCNDEKVFTPKPRMYPRVVYPDRAYEDFILEACHFTFQKPAYAEVQTGIKFFGQEPNDPCWFDLNMKGLNATMHFSYNKIEGENTLQKLVTDAFKIVSEHNSKAEYTEEALIENKNGVKGLTFNLEGPVASPVNFFLTDTLNHFVRASLYFNSEVNADSTAPVLKFINQDVDKILSTFEWLD